MRAVHGNAFLAPGTLILASSNQSGGSPGAALLNTIAASAAANYLTAHAPHVSPLAAAVHGDVIVFTFLIVLFAVGAIATALLYPRRKPAALA
jgi:hypothetical protein